MAAAERLTDLARDLSAQGRAIDVGLLTRYRINRHWDVSLGYRTIEGGADNDSVYNFAWFHSSI